MKKHTKKHSKNIHVYVGYRPYSVIL